MIIGGEIDQGIADESTRLGFAFKISAETDRRSLTLSALHAWLTTPIRLKQIAFVLNARGVPLAYATWAFVTAATASRLAAGNGRAPMLEEWNDGTIVWIVDVIAPHGHCGALVRAVRDLFSGSPRTFGFVDRRAGTVRLMRSGAEGPSASLRPCPAGQSRA